MTTPIEADRIMDAAKHIPELDWEQVQERYPVREVGRCRTEYSCQGRMVQFTHEDYEWRFRVERTQLKPTGVRSEMSLLLGRMLFTVEAVTREGNRLSFFLPRGLCLSVRLDP